MRLMDAEFRNVTYWASDDTGEGRCSPLLSTCAVHCLQPPKAPTFVFWRPGSGQRTGKDVCALLGSVEFGRETRS